MDRVDDLVDGARKVFLFVFSSVFFSPFEFSIYLSSAVHYVIN